MLPMLLALLLSSCWIEITQCRPSSSGHIAKKCPIKFYYNSDHCAESGWVQAPQIMSTSNQSALLDCGAACLSTPKCKGLRYNEDSKRCDLYSASFKEMFTSFENPKPGLLYDRLCFTESCGAQAACEATETEDCKRIIVQQYFEAIYTQSTCSYGHISHAFDDPRTISKLYNGTMDVCDVIKACARRACAYFDVHYLQASQQWECLNMGFVSFSYSGGRCAHDFSNETSYTVRNTSVGAGYLFSIVAYVGGY